MCCASSLSCATYCFNRTKNRAECLSQVECLATIAMMLFMDEKRIDIEHYEGEAANYRPRC